MRRRTQGLNYYRVGQIIYGAFAVFAATMMIGVILNLPIVVAIFATIIAVAAYTFKEMK